MSFGRCASSYVFQSTHPVWGATHATPAYRMGKRLFQSTHPVWGATAEIRDMCDSVEISIHAPRVGCDLSI